MGDESDVGDYSIGLSEAIAALRSGLLAAQAAGAGADVQLPVDSMTVVLQVAATRSSDGKAGFRVPVLNVELGATAGWQREAMQTVTVVFGTPVEPTGIR